MASHTQIGKCREFPAYALSGAIAHVGRGCRSCAMGATKEPPANFDSLAYHSAPAVLANWGHGLDRALETIEDVASAGSDQFETLVAFVTTHFTDSHKEPPSCL